MFDQLQEMLPAAITGSIVRTSGLTVAAADFPVPVGALVEIDRFAGEPLPAEVIGFHDDLTLLFPLADVGGVGQGNPVRLVRTTRLLQVGTGLLGRVINSEGKVIDSGPPPVLTDRARRDRPAPPATARPPIDAPVSTGIRAIDGLLTCGEGQRMGIFSGSGVGKSTALGMMARHSTADVIVVALIGERGREVNDFLARELSPSGRARSVVVVATGDEPAIRRVHAAGTALAVAEYFRDQGRKVLLLFDSLTRLAMAQREIGLATGEPPATRGYPPSVFAMLPKLIERTGRSERGSITAFFSVLVEGDDPHEPISDAVRGLLDGHTWLSRDLAAAGHFPAIDILESVSRLAPALMDKPQRQAAAAVRRCLAAYRQHADLIAVGAYRAGSNRDVDTAIALQEVIANYLRQDVAEAAGIEEARTSLLTLHAQIAERTTS